MIWPWSKVVSTKEQGGINWEALLVDIHADVRTSKTEIEDIKKDSVEGRRGLEKHCTNEEKNWTAFKEHVCKKIDNITCPRNGEIDAVVKDGKERRGKYGELKQSVETYTKAVTDMVGEQETTEKIKKAIWRRVVAVLTILFLGMSAVAIFVTWLMGLWGG